MQNINTVRQNILETVNVGMIIESFNPVSMQGSALKKILVESNNALKLQSITSLTEMIFECNKARHIDASAFQLGEDISEHLSDNIKAKLVFCFESVNQLPSNGLLESLKSKLDDLVILEDAEIVKQIRSGSLNAYKSIKPVCFIIESVNIVSDMTSDTASHEAYHPVSYTEINEAGTVFIRLTNHVYAINENNVVTANAPSPKFAFLSSIVEALSYDYENNAFVVEHESLGKFSINESMITRVSTTSDTVNEHVTSKSLVDELSMIVESAEYIKGSKSSVNEQRQFIDAIVAIYENYDSLTIADNVVIVECKKSSDKFALITAGEKTYVSTLKSNRLPNILESFSNIVDALTTLKRKSGYSANHFFTKQLLALNESTNDKLAKINAQKLIVEKLETKASEISALLNEEQKQDVRNTAKITKLNEALQLNNAFILEQKTALANLL